MARPSKEYQAFRNLTDRLLTVSKETVDKRIAAYKAEREKLPRSQRPGPNPKGYLGGSPVTLSETRAQFTVAQIARAIHRSPRWVLDQVYDGKLTATFTEKHVRKTSRLFSLSDVRRYSESVAQALIEDQHAA